MTSAHAFDPARVARVTSALALTPDDPRSSLCVASASVTRVSSAGVVLIMHGRALGTVCASDPVAETVEEMQYTFGEGPCVDAFSSRQPVLIPDLAAVDVVRWPGFRDGALAAGIRAAFGFPIFIGTVCIGALDLYHDHQGSSARNSSPTRPSWRMWPDAPSSTGSRSPALVPSPGSSSTFRRTGRSSTRRAA